MGKLGSVSLAAIAAAMVAVAGAACGGRAAPLAAPVGAQPGAAVAPAEGASAIAPPGGLRRAFAAMRADTDLVLALDFRQLRASAIYRRYEAGLRDGLGDALSSLRDRCGLDPLEQVSGVLLGAAGPGLEHVTVFVRGLERVKVEACLRDRVAVRKFAGEPVRWTVAGDYVEYAEDDLDAPARFLWLDARTFLLIRDGDTTAGEAVLRAAAGARAGDGLASSPAFAQLVERTRTDAPVWFLLRGQAPSFASTLGAFAPRTVRGVVDLDEGMRGELVLSLEDGDQARSVAGEVERQLAQVRTSPFGDVLTGVAVRQDGEEVVIRAVFSKVQLEQLARVASGLGGP